MAVVFERQLWAINQVGGGPHTNERAANIGLHRNPVELNPWFTNLMFTIRLGLEDGWTFSGLTIYAAQTSLAFPAPGSVAEAIVTVNGAVIATGEGVARAPTVPDGFDRTPLRQMPRFLLLEYSAVAAGGGTTDLEIYLVATGPNIDGFE